jgi:hypothetical protein
MLDGGPLVLPENTEKKLTIYELMQANYQNLKVES